MSDEQIEQALRWFEDEPPAMESFKHDTKRGRILAAEVRRLRECVQATHPVESLKGKPSLVLYFEDQTGRDEFVVAAQLAKPHMRTVKLP